MRCQRVRMSISVWFEHVAHVQPAGDVGRRQQNGEGLAVQAFVLQQGAGWAKSFSRTQYSAQ